MNKPPLKFTRDQTLFYRHNTLICSGKYLFVRHMKAKDATPDELKLSGTEYFIDGRWVYEESIKTTMEELL